MSDEREVKTRFITKGFCNVRFSQAWVMRRIHKHKILTLIQGIEQGNRRIFGKRISILH